MNAFYGSKDVKTAAVATYLDSLTRPERRSWGFTALVLGQVEPSGSFDAIGLPLWLSAAGDALFDCLPATEARDWGACVLSSVPIGGNIAPAAYVLVREVVLWHASTLSSSRSVKRTDDGASPIARLVQFLDATAKYVGAAGQGVGSASARSAMTLAQVLLMDAEPVSGFQEAAQHAIAFVDAISDVERATSLAACVRAAVPSRGVSGALTEGIYATSPRSGARGSFGAYRTAAEADFYVRWVAESLIVALSNSSMSLAEA